MKKIMALTLAAVMASAPVCAMADSFEREIASYPWARESAEYCFNNGILSGDEFGNFDLGGNLTRAQMARIFTDAFGLERAADTQFDDFKASDWYADYSLALQNYMPKKDADFKGGEYVTREEFAATLVAVSGGKPSKDTSVTVFNFGDAAEVDDAYKNWVETAVLDRYLLGDGGNVLPKNLLTRAEACAFLYRALEPSADKTLITGKPEVTLEQAVSWAKSKNAADIYLEVAPIYWYYGEQFGIRPDVMFAQAAKETGYGKYTGTVKPEMNNWAGIKIQNPTPEKLIENFESFATPDDGVRGHFNHMSAYVGVPPIGEVHGRYNVVKSLDWAGTVRYVEELGGRWCPEINYGADLVKWIEEMKQF